MHIFSLSQQLVPVLVTIIYYIILLFIKPITSNFRFFSVKFRKLYSRLVARIDPYIAVILRFKPLES